MVNSSEQQSEFEASLESKEENCPTKVYPVDEACPVCGEKIYKSGRCITCYSCGWSTCSI